MISVILDTGPLVALLNRRDRHHAWARDVLDGVDPPIFTCDPVLSEACFLLRDLAGGPDAVLELVARGIVRSDFRISSEADALRGLMKKYASIPMSLADSCLVRMTELDTKSVVVTLDSDFRIYRRHRRQVVPTISPSHRGR